MSNACRESSFLPSQQTHSCQVSFSLGTWKKGRECLQQYDSSVMVVDMLTKSVSVKVLGVCMKLVGMAKSGYVQT